MPKEKILFIFGAGASFDCVDPHNGSKNLADYQPPLTNGLFANTDAQNGILVDDMQSKKLTQIIPNIIHRTTNGQSLEDILEEYYDEAQKLPHRQQQLNELQNYLRNYLFKCSKFYVRSGSNYGRLIDAVRTKEQEAIFVTFNYDTILENDLQAAYDDVFFSRTEDYIKSPIPLIKVHGSWNWYYGSLDIEIIGNEVNQVKRIPDKEPALGLPYRQAKKFILPGHIEFLQNELRNVGKIIIIGWRGNEQHFMPVIKDNIGMFDLVVVNKGQEECDNVRHLFSDLQVNDYKAYPDGFTDFLNAPDFLTYIKT